MNTALSTAHSTAFHINSNPNLLCSAAIKFHNKTLNISYRSSTAHSFCMQDRTIPAMPSSNYIAATHNVTHSPCTSTCTTHPPLPSPLPSTTLLCTQLTSLVPRPLAKKNRLVSTVCARATIPRKTWGSSLIRVCL